MFTVTTHDITLKFALLRSAKNDISWTENVKRIAGLRSYLKWMHLNIICFDIITLRLKFNGSIFWMYDSWQLSNCRVSALRRAPEEVRWCHVFSPLCLRICLASSFETEGLLPLIAKSSFLIYFATSVSYLKILVLKKWEKESDAEYWFTRMQIQTS